MAQLLFLTKLDDAQTNYIDTLMMSAASLLTLIDDIFGFSKIEAGKLEIKPTVINLESLIEGATDLLGIRAQERKMCPESRIL